MNKIFMIVILVVLTVICNSNLMGGYAQYHDLDN